MVFFIILSAYLWLLAVLVWIFCFKITIIISVKSTVFRYCIFQYMDLIHTFFQWCNEKFISNLFYIHITTVCSPFGDLFNDTAEFTLCYGLHDCSHLFQGYFIHSLSTLYYYNAPSLTTRLTGDYRDRTYTGKCSPALLDTRKRKAGNQKDFLLGETVNITF